MRPLGNMAHTGLGPAVASNVAARLGGRMTFQADFDLDIPLAIHSQLLTVFESLTRACLTDGALDGPLQVARGAGVYGLHLEEELVYVGKAGDLAIRIDQHRAKISGRHNISTDSVGFKCV